MARPPRIDACGAIHHITARGNNKEDIFVDSRDRRLYLRLLAETTQAMEWSCFAFCLMTNHVHLLVETPKPTLSDGMHQLHGTYARIFNKRHKRLNHLFGRRFSSELITSDRQLIAVIEYIANNPVDAGLCEAPRLWPWSSFRDEELGGPPTWLDLERLRVRLDERPVEAASIGVQRAQVEVGLAGVGA